MPLTPTDIVKQFEQLELRGIYRPAAWTVRGPDDAIDLEASQRKLAAVVAAWLEDLEALTPDALAAAFKAHRTGPRGSMFPSTADILAAAGSSTKALPNPDEAAWQIIVNAPRTAELYHRLDPAQRHALGLVGRWEITRAEGDMARGALRKRFMAACEGYRASELRAIEGGKAGELPDNVRSMVRGVLQ